MERSGLGSVGGNLRVDHDAVLLHPRLVTTVGVLDEQLDGRDLRGQWVIERRAGVAGAHRLLGAAGVEGVDDDPRGEPATETVTATQRFVPAPPPPGQSP